MMDAKDQRTKDHIAMTKDCNVVANNFVTKDQTLWHLSKEDIPSTWKFCTISILHYEDGHLSKYVI